MGFPDGWNNLAYCNNRVTTAIDWLGGRLVIDTRDAWVTQQIYAGSHLNPSGELCELFDEYSEYVTITDTKEYAAIPKNDWINAINSGATALSVVSGTVGAVAGVIALSSGGTVTAPAAVVAAVAGGVAGVSAFVAWLTTPDAPDEYLVSQTTTYSNPMISNYIRTIHSNCRE